MQHNRFTKFISGLAFVCLFMLGALSAHAQPQSPCDADPFCSDSSYVFPNAIAGTLPAGITQGCLTTAPCPMWYFMQIGVSGTMQLTMIQTGPTGNQLDIDFALYGPFVDVPTGCAAVLAGAAPIQCSYSPSFTETIGLGLPGGAGAGASTPPAAVVGQVYIVLLTNFSQQPGTIDFSQTAGTGETDCGIVCGLSASNSGPACVGVPITLTGINTDTVNVYSYYWTGPGGYTSNNKVATFNPTTGGTFQFDLMAISADDDTCHATTEVLVYPLPNVVLADAGDKVLCNIDSVILEVAAPGTGTKYQWYKDNVALAGDTTASLTVYNTGTFQVIGITPHGCTDTSEDVYVKLSFTQVDFDFTIMKGCLADSVQFTNLSETGLYWWNFGDGTQPDDTTTNPAHTYQDQNSYVVRLKLQDSDGCVDSVLKIVDVTHPLIAEFTSNVDSVCQTDGTPVQFTDASTGAVTGWRWDFNDGGTSTQTNPSHTFTMAGNRAVRLIINDAIPCYDTVFHNIYVDSLPFLEVVADKHAICIGDEVNFTASYLHPAVSLNWDFGDGTHWLQENSATHSYDQEGTHWVTVTADYPVCASAVVTDSIVVKSLPVVNLGPDSVICLDGPSVTVTDINNASDPTVTWLWNTGATTSSIEIVHPGIYTVTATRNDCSTTGDIEVNKDCYTDVPNAFTPNGDGVNDYFYPRQLLSKGVASFTMAMFNRWGQKVFETSKIDGRGWDGKFNAKDQPTGVYIYQIKAVLKNGRVEEYTGNVTLMR
jgi:gliding motility-associated-like protein